MQVYKIPALFPLQTYITRTTAIGSLIHRLLFISFVALLCFHSKELCSDENATSRAISAFVLMMLIFSLPILFSNVNKLMQKPFSSPRGIVKIILFLMCVILPISEVWFLLKRFKKEKVFCFWQYPTHPIEPFDLKPSAFDSLNCWLYNRYTEPINLHIVSVTEANKIAKKLTEYGFSDILFEGTNIQAKYGDTLFDISLLWEGYIISCKYGTCEILYSCENDSIAKNIAYSISLVAKKLLIDH